MTLSEDKNLSIQRNATALKWSRYLEHSKKIKESLPFREFDITHIKLVTYTGNSVREGKKFEIARD